MAINNCIMKWSVFMPALVAREAHANKSVAIPQALKTPADQSYIQPQIWIRGGS